MRSAQAAGGRWHWRRRAVLGRAGCGARGSKLHGPAGAGRHAGKARGAGAGYAGLGVLLGQWAVHSVHSACFWPGLTQ